MANIKITDLTAYTDPLNTDVLPIVDVTSDTTKKVSIADLLKNASAGTAAAPGIAFDGDPNTGIYSPGADQVAVSTGGTGRLFIDANGRVGVGTSTLGYDLEIAGTSNVYTRVRNASNNTTLVGIEGAESVIYGTTTAGSALPIVFKTGSAERLRIASDGKLGVGTSSPNYLISANSSTTVSALQFTNSSTGSTVSDGFLVYNNGLNAILSNEEAGDLRLQTSGLQRVTIDSSGKVGIGTMTPDYPLTVHSSAGASSAQFTDATNSTLRISHYSSNVCRIAVGNNQHLALGTGFAESARIDSSGRLLVGTSTSTGVGAGAGSLQQIFSNSQSEFASFHLGFATPGSASPVISLSRSRSTTYGNYSSVGSGDSLGRIKFVGDDGTDYVSTAAQIEAVVDGTPGTNDMPGRLVFSTTADGASSPTERVRITSDGSVGIGGTPATFFHVNQPGANSTARISANDPDGVIRLELVEYQSSSLRSGALVKYDGSANNLKIGTLTTAFADVTAITIARGSTDVAIAGALSKGSGSFKIDHPLPQKKDTHYLVHSFIEGPQADLIYRGHVQLANGQASVNIDEAARMTEGTFESLCSNVCCFTTNETDWTAVRGSVEGNILTIEAQDPTSTAEVCWMVIGERKDKHMLETEWTDENGRVITEPLKEPVHQDDLPAEPQ
jgi:hypothetical protein